ncbi:MAG: ester cyclase [Serratia inhibens]
MASKTFRQAAPDLRCEVTKMIVSGDRVVAHLHFSGHFTAIFRVNRERGNSLILFQLISIRSSKEQ